MNRTATSKVVVEVTVPGETHSLALVRKIVTHLATEVGFPEEEVDKIEIAVDEACTNVMEHAYRTVTPKPPVQLHVRADEGEFVVDIIDRGQPFDLSTYTPPRFPDHWHAGHTRGVGLYLIKQCMDETIYERLPDQINRLRLIKRFVP
jgi:serine/threonine-protein kinase RsbW